MRQCGGHGGSTAGWGAARREPRGSGEPPRTANAEVWPAVGDGVVVNNSVVEGATRDGTKSKGGRASQRLNAAPRARAIQRLRAAAHSPSISVDDRDTWRAVSDGEKRRVLSHPKFRGKRAQLAVVSIPPLRLLTSNTNRGREIPRP